MDLGGGLGHLSYSTLVHPGDTWEEMWDSVRTYVPQVKARVCPDRPFGLSLRISAASAATLAGDPGARAALRRFLAEEDLYLYTVNAFPYGPFKGRDVKEQVYEPDWRSEERTTYTCAVADVLAEVCDPDIAPSIQTPPLGFKPNVTDAGVVAVYTDHVVRVAAHLVGLERRTGRTVTLAIEPEPACYLETTDEVVAWFGEHLYTAAAARRLGELAGLPVSEAIGALRRHVGIVFDTCHQALEYEDIPASLAKLEEAGVPVLKLQQAAAIRVPEVTQDEVDALRPFAETIYLTQTLELRAGVMTRYLNLEDAFAAWEADPGPREWRVHVHVPVFLDDLGVLGSTQDAIADALRVHRARPVSRHLEVETYTWDVLPDALKTGDIVDYVSRELAWVRDQLGGGGAVDPADLSTS